MKFISTARVGPGWLNRRSLAWASYDIASSVYVGVAPVLLFPLYFTERLHGFANPTSAWGAVVAAAVVFSSLAALGSAVWSRRVHRFSLLCLFTAGLVVALAVLALLPGLPLAVAVLSFVVAQSFYFAAVTVYESFLPDLLPPGSVQKLSGFGWSLGYLGGLLGIVILLAFVADRAASAEVLAFSIGLLALISTVLSMIALWVMWRVGFARLQIPSASALAKISGPLAILRNWRRHRVLFLLLAGMLLISCGISVIVTFTAPILANRFGQGLADLLWLLLMLHLLAVPSTVFWSFLLTNWSRSITLSILLGSWCVVPLLLSFGSGPWVPSVTVAVIGCCLGATMSAFRGFVAEIVPDGAGPAYFALATVVSRAAAAMGPAIFAVVSAWGSEQIALLAMLALMTVGSALLIRHQHHPRPI
ncbi:MFS transporter [Aestuariivirga sp.]|uniref:MFS transporter n=1 Tax=Aestuariivirga sp. TaxID=2650926 RepID=UPI00378485CC